MTDNELAVLMDQYMEAGFIVKDESTNQEYVQLRNPPNGTKGALWLSFMLRLRMDVGAFNSSEHSRMVEYDGVERWSGYVDLVID